MTLLELLIWDTKHEVNEQTQEVLVAAAEAGVPVQACPTASCRGFKFLHHAKQQYSVQVYKNTLRLTRVYGVPVARIYLQHFTTTPLEY